MKTEKIKQSASDTLNSIKRSTPSFLGILLLIALMNNIVPENFYKKIFTGHDILDSLTGSAFGSIAAGNPVNSYVLGGELLEQGVSLMAITAFILSWVTVGIIQLPAESIMLGKKFAITRNIFSFFSAIIIAMLVVYTLSFL